MGIDMEKNNLGRFIKMAKTIGIASDVILDLIELKTAIDEESEDFDEDGSEECSGCFKLEENCVCADGNDNDSETITLDDIRSEVYQMSQQMSHVAPLINEGKAEIGDIRKKLDEVKHHVILQIISNTYESFRKKFGQSDMETLKFANQQLQEGMKELKETNKVILVGVDTKIKERTTYVHLTEQKVKDLEKDLKEIRSDRDHLKSQTKQLRRANHELRTSINRLEADNISLRTEREVLKKSGGCYHNRLSMEDESRVEKERQEFMNDLPVNKGEQVDD